MSKYGSYPNPDLCDKHGKALQDCLTCSFDGNCQFQDKLELIRKQTISGVIEDLEKAVSKTPQVRFLFWLVDKLNDALIWIIIRITK